MKKPFSLGYVIVVVAATGMMEAANYFAGPSGASVMSNGATGIALIGAMILLLRGPVARIWPFVARRSPEQVRHQRERASRVGASGGTRSAFDLAASRLIGLKSSLGERPHRRRPRLLLTGDDAVVSRLLPELVEPGWLITDAAVLLWSKTDHDNRPDEAWLRELYTLRRNRPIDAVVLTLDGAADLSAPRRGANVYSMNLARIADVLRWSAPVYVLDVAQSDTATNGRTALIGCEFERDANEHAIEATLFTVRNHLGHLSVGQLIRNPQDRYGVELSQRLDTHISPLAGQISALSNSNRHQAVSGAFFAPYPLPEASGTQGASISADLPLWPHLATLACAQRGHRIGWRPMTVFSTLALCAIGVWTAGMLASGVSNAHSVFDANQSLQTLKSAPDPAAHLRALLDLQQQIAAYEARIAHGPPLWSRFGLNQDTATLAALWPRYADAARLALIDPIQQSLEAELVDLSQMPIDQLSRSDDHASSLALNGHAALKTYLMLADPSRADASFMTPQLIRYWSTRANLPTGAKLDLSERQLSFYAQRLKAHDTWRIQPRLALVNATRQTLLSVIGVRNAEDTVYQSIVAGAGNKYPDQTLTSLTAGADTRGLFRTSAMVPGIYTRQAYEGYVKAAITEAAGSRDVSRDWVLTGTASTADHEPIESADALEAALTAQYFADYGEHWQDFMNSMQWQSASNISTAIEQMKLLADARQSPVIALMKSLVYQGGAGAREASFSDTLVARAQNILGKKDDAPESAKAQAAAPLDSAFGPVLRLVGQIDPAPTTANATATSDVSLQRYLERVTALRLKLQQITNSADTDMQARQLAQAMFRGRSSDLADTQAYAQLIAASLGEQWAGMGDALFVHPVSQATQIVLQPAQASLNEAWRQTIVAGWNKSFAGRYPFANTDNDASLPELARFVRAQGGLIPAFLAQQLAGVLELQGDQWVAVNTRGAALALDPAFLKAVNTLQRISGRLLAQGEPQYRFDIKPVPSPGITDTVLTLDAQKLHYYNQRETWQGLMWPSSDPQTAGTRLQWQTEQAGANKNFEFGGRWAWVRMLERAEVEPIDSATFRLTWLAAPDTRTGLAPLSPTMPDIKSAQGSRDQWRASEPNSSDSVLDSLTTQAPLARPPSNLTHSLSYLMRTEVGKGPLELLALRGFVLPERMFIERPSRIASASKTANPPPLPKAAIDAGRRADVPLPGGVGEGT